MARVGRSRWAPQALIDFTAPYPTRSIARRHSQCAAACGRGRRGTRPRCTFPAAAPPGPSVRALSDTIDDTARRLMMQVSRALGIDARDRISHRSSGRNQEYTMRRKPDAPARGITNLVCKRDCRAVLATAETTYQHIFPSLWPHRLQNKLRCHFRILSPLAALCARKQASARFRPRPPASFLPRIDRVMTHNNEPICRGAGERFFQPVKLLHRSMCAHMSPRIKLGKHLRAEHPAVDLLQKHAARVGLVQDHSVNRHQLQRLASDRDLARGRVVVVRHHPPAPASPHHHSAATARARMHRC